MRHLGLLEVLLVAVVVHHMKKRRVRPLRTDPAHERAVCHVGGQGCGTWTGDTWTITGGVRNIFNEAPPQVSDIIQTSAGNTPLSATAYDIRGRRAFVSVSKTF